MNGVVKGILIGLAVCGLLGLGGCIATLLIVEETVEVVDDSIVEVEQESKELSEQYNKLVQGIEWTFETDEYGETIVQGVLENTTDKEIEYIEIEYKFLKEGIVVDSGWTNACNIAPKDKVLIEFWTYKEFDSMKVKGTDGWN